jgi:hypothetical protein
MILNYFNFNFVFFNFIDCLRFSQLARIINHKSQTSGIRKHFHMAVAHLCHGRVGGAQQVDADHVGDEGQNGLQHGDVFYVGSDEFN